MRKILLITFTIFSSYFYGQEILMQNGTVNGCSGIFLDSGGADGNYSNNENFTITICPDSPGEKLEINFTEFNLQLNVDLMYIHNGDSVASPLLGVFSGSLASSPGSISSNNINNSSGCLTIRFISNESLNSTGWSADISCYMPCQLITSQLDSAEPEPDTDGFIKVCVNEPITLTGSGNFQFDGTGATYEWDLGNGNIVSGSTATFSYDTPGVYIVNLNIRDANLDANPLGCGNTNLINQVIQVASEVDFTGTQATDDTLCFGATTTIVAVANTESIVYNCPPPVSGTTFLPDGSGAVYNTCVTVDCFESDAVLTDVTQLLDICMNIEHSYLGDLQIKIISPNGQQAILKAYPGGGNKYLGGANDDETTTPGVGADYCFSMNATQLLVNGPTIMAGIPLSASIVAGTYLPSQSFENLLGSPLNGDWCLEVVDNLAIDNGYVFSWELNFDPDIPMQEFSFTPTIVSEYWENNPSIIEVNENIITVAPETEGIHCYNYVVLDDFGCEYVQEVCINVAPESETPITYYEDFDGDGYGNSNVETIECSSIPPNGYVANNLDCDDTNYLINVDAEDIPDNGIDENCDGVDGAILNIDELNDRNVSIYPNPFDNNITLSLPLSLNGSDLDVNIYDLNGRLVYTKSKSIVINTMNLTNLNALEKAVYFIKISVKGTDNYVIKKLIKF